MSEPPRIEIPIASKGRTPVAQGSVLDHVLNIIAQQIARRLAADGTPAESGPTLTDAAQSRRVGLPTDI